MHSDKFADSYDYVKRVLLGMIAPPHDWLVHPMLFYATRQNPIPGGGLDIGQYAQLLNLPEDAVVHEIEMTWRSVAKDVSQHPNGNLLIDPDKGIPERHTNRAAVGGTQHVAVGTISKIARARPEN